MNTPTLPVPSVERSILAAGYTRSTLCPVADINAAVEAGCSWCLCHGSLELRPYWKGMSLRLVVVCHECHFEEER